MPIRPQKKIMKLPRNLKGQAVADLNVKLNALPQQLQMPKGPVPRNARMPKAAPAPDALTPHPDDGGLHPDDGGARGLVLQAAQVPVHHQGRDDEHQQHGPDQGPAEAHRHPVQPDHPQAEQPLADREAGGGGEHEVLDPNTTGVQTLGSTNTQWRARVTGDRGTRSRSGCR